MSAEIHKLPTRDVKRFKRAGENLLLNTHSGIYYAKKSFDRYKIPPLFASTGFGEKEKQKARARVLELIKEHLDRYLGPNRDVATRRKNAVSVGQVMDEYLQSSDFRELRTRTQANKVDFIAELREHWGRYHIEANFSELWAAWLPGFRTLKRQRRIAVTEKQNIKNPRLRETFNDYAKTFNGVLTYARKKKYLNYFTPIPYLDKKKGQTGRVYTDEEITRLWHAMSANMQDQYLLCFESMMRKREAICLPKDRFDSKTGVITLRPEDVKTGSKTGRGRAFKVSEDLKARLLARINSNPDSPYFFPSPKNPMKPVNDNKKAWKGAVRRARLEGRCRWHDLRHSAITKALIDAGANPVMVSQYAGVSIRTIENVYLHNEAEKTAAVANVVKVKREKQ